MWLPGQSGIEGKKAADALFTFIFSPKLREGENNGLKRNTIGIGEVFRHVRKQKTLLGIFRM